MLIPNISKIQPLSQELIRVTFDSLVVNLSNLLDPSRYQFSHSLEAIGVTISGPNTVDIVTSEQVADCYYTLEIKAD